MRAKKRVSQQMIAKELGISQALVSLALNGRKEGISADTYAKIWEHAARVGYQPKGMKFDRTPAGVRQRQVGFILRSGLSIHNQGSYFGHVLHGLHTELASRGHSTAFLGSEDDLGRARLAELFPSNHPIRGVVLLGEVAPGFLRELRSHEHRVVAVSARHPGQCHSVIGNEPQALDLLVGYLLKQGHRRFGWLGGNKGLTRHATRLTAFHDALQSRGLKADARYCVSFVQGDRAEGGEAIRSLLPLARRKDFPTAFICYNTLMAAGAVGALQREGWKVPEEISIAGADNSRLAAAESPKITVAGSDAEKLGAAAGRIILDSTGADDESMNDLMLPAQLVLGGSTGPAP